MIREIMVYVPKTNLFIKACEGTGDNLLSEDIEAGYVDYVYIEVYAWNGNEFIEIDGAQKMLTKMFDETYEKDTDGNQLIMDAIDMVYGTNLPYIIIPKYEEN